MEEKITITVYTESLWQSIVADVVSVLMLCGMFYANAHYIQSKLFAAIIVILFALKMIAYVSGRKTMYRSREEAIAALQTKP